MRNKLEFTHLELEATLCVWECINDRTMHENHHHAGMTEWRDEHGSVACRHASIPLAKYVLAVYDAGNAAHSHGDAWDRWTYDWEIVPAILDTVTFSAAGFEMPTDYGAQAAAVIATLLKLPGFKTDAQA